MSSRLSLLIPLLLLLAGCVSPAVDPSLPVPAEQTPPPESGSAPEAAPFGAAAPPPMKAEPGIAKVRKSKPRPSSPPPDAAPPMPQDLASQPIDELVIRPTSLTGYWRLTASHSIDVEIGLFSGVQIHYGGELRDRNICWLQQTGRRLEAWCSSGSVLKLAEGSVEDDGVTLRWWSGPANIIFAGKLTEAAHIEGGFSGGVIGLSVTGNVPASLTRLDRPVTGGRDPDRPSAALLRAVWSDVASGQLLESRYDGSGIKRVNQGLTREAAADPPLSLAFLGEILIRWRKEQREFSEDVYQVDGAQGRQLCRIAVTAAQTVADFNCVKLPPG